MNELLTTFPYKFISNPINWFGSNYTNFTCVYENGITKWTDNSDSNKYWTAKGDYYNANNIIKQIFGYPFSSGNQEGHLNLLSASEYTLDFYGIHGTLTALSMKFYGDYAGTSQAGKSIGLQATLTADDNKVITVSRGGKGSVNYTLSNTLDIDNHLNIHFTKWSTLDSEYGISICRIHFELEEL